MTNGEGWGIEDNDIMGGYLPQEKTRVPRNCAGEIPKIRTSDGNCAELRDEGTVFFISPKKRAQGGIEAGKMQLKKIKTTEKRRESNFMLDGEVVSRSKNIGKKWQGRVQHQKRGGNVSADNQRMAGDSKI